MTEQQEQQKQEVIILRGRDALRDTCECLGVRLEKHPQANKSPVCNPKSPLYNENVAKRRAKEKARRRHNARLRAARGK